LMEELNSTMRQVLKNNLTYINELINNWFV